MCVQVIKGDLKLLGKAMRMQSVLQNWAVRKKTVSFQG